MLSTRKQKAKEKRSRQSDVMSDLEKVDIMLEIFSRNDLDSQLGERENEGDIQSNGLQTGNPTTEDFRSLINTKSRINRGITIETARLINNEITTQVTRKLDEIKEDLNTQILKVINTAIAEKVLHSIQKVLGVENLGLNANRDHQYGGLDRSPDDHFGHMDHRSRRLNKGQRNYSGNTIHWSKRLTKGLGDYSGQMDHQSGRGAKEN